MAIATVKREKTRPQVKRTTPKKVSKGLVGNILADFMEVLPRSPSYVIIVFYAQATAVFVFASSTFGEAAVGLEHIGLPPVAAGLAVLVVALVVLDTFNQSVLGEGTLNNPVNSLGFAAAGKGPFISHMLRIIAQVGGGVLGAGGALYVLPSTWKRTLGPLAQGVKPGVSLASGVACEFILAFLLNLAIFASMGTQLKYVGALLPLVATVILVVAGSGLTGPSMNPAHAFSWNYFLQGHDITEHLAVFWVAPLSGALLAGLVWTMLTKSPIKKQLQGAKFHPKKNAGRASEAKKDK